MAGKDVTRRGFLVGSAAAFGLAIVPRNVLGGEAQEPPSDVLGGALIGCGGQGGGTFNQLGRSSSGKRGEVKRLASCDVRYKDKADNKATYSDFRRVLERKDIDVVAIGTPPHWHALISIAAMEAGKDVMSEKPMTRFIAEGRAVVNAQKRYGRIFQVGTFGRYDASKGKHNIQMHKAFMQGILQKTDMVHHHKGGFKVKEWSGMVVAPPQPIPASLDWDMYCGPSPLRPYHPHRVGGTHRGYWDYEGGGLADMGQHHFDPVQWIYGKDDTSPVSIEAYAPPAHPECAAMWGWIELIYADGFTIVLESTEWGEPYTRKQDRDVNLSDLSEEDQKKVQAMPDPESFPAFPEAVKTRKKTGGHAEAAHRCATLLHLANIGIRLGRKLRYDPVKEEFIGDPEANRLVSQPMRAPWRL